MRGLEDGQRDDEERFPNELTRVREFFRTQSCQDKSELGALPITEL